jgi:hypothetical protein
MEVYGQLHATAALSPGKEPLAPNIQEARSASGPILVPKEASELQFLRHPAHSLVTILIEVFQLHNVGKLKLLLYDYSDCSLEHMNASKYVNIIVQA